MRAATPDNRSNPGSAEPFDPETLHARFRWPLMRHFLRHVHNHAEAEDLTQDVFVRLLGASQVTRIQNVGSFAFRIATNLLHDRGRRAQSRHAATSLPVSNEAIAELANEAVEDRAPERVLLARESLNDVIAALNELDEVTRDIFILFRLEKMKQREIADQLGVALRTVERHVTKATLHLALRFGPQE